MEINMDPKHKQMLDDVFDAFTMLTDEAIISLMHVEGGFTRYTASAIDLLGLPGEYIPNGAMDWNDYLHPEDRKRYMDAMMPLLEGKTRTYDLTYRVRLKSGEYCAFRAVGAVLRDAEGKPSVIGGALINEGITGRIDPVTTLPNQIGYLDDLKKMIHNGKKTISLKIGLNKFSETTQVHGYTYSNRLLQEISWMIQEISKERYKTYRLNGASFALLTDSLSRNEMASIYDAIRYHLQKGIELNGTKNILLSNGGMVSTFNSEADADTILSCVNYACEDSRQHLHGGLADFNGSVHYDNDASLDLISAIRNCALDGCKGFHIEYLPVISAKDGKMTGAEEMLYWEDEQYGKVSSDDFLPILEQDFVFEEIGDFILKQSLEDGVKMLEARPGFYLCINIYRMQAEADHFLDDLFYFIEESGFPPQLLSLKLTSGCRLIDLKHIQKLIERLHQRQIMVILDGFGSGTNSILFLKNTALDGVCLDRQFITGIESQGRDRDILEYLTKMAASCIEHINANAVHTKEVSDILKSLPVTTMQGDYYSMPLSCEELIEKMT